MVKEGGQQQLADSHAGVEAEEGDGVQGSAGQQNGEEGTSTDVEVGASAEEEHANSELDVEHAAAEVSVVAGLLCGVGGGWGRVIRMAGVWLQAY